MSTENNRRLQANLRVDSADENNRSAPRFFRIAISGGTIEERATVGKLVIVAMCCRDDRLTADDLNVAQGASSFEIDLDLEKKWTHSEAFELLCIAEDACKIRNLHQ